MIVVLLIGTFIWIIALRVYVRSPLASIFHPATYYLFFQGFVFVVRPWMNWYYDYTFIYNFFQFAPSDSERMMALLATDLGFIAFMFCVMRYGNAPLSLRPTVRGRIDLQRLYRWPLFVTAVLCAPIGIYSLRMVVSTKANDASTMLRDAGTGIAYNTNSIGYLVEAGNMLIPIVVLIPWLFRFRWWSLLPFLGYTVARLFDGNARWTFVMAAASLSLMFLYDQRKRWFNGKAVLLGAVVFGLFTVLGQERAFFLSQLTNVPVDVGTSPFELRPLEDENYANQEFMEYLVHVIPTRTGTYDWFLDNLQVLTEPVPRKLWPGKPIGAPIKLYQLFDYGFPLGMTFSLPGEGWAQAGFIGVFLWCAFFGMIYGKFYNWFMRSQQTEFQVGAYVLLLPLSIQFYRDGTLLTFIKFPFFYMVPLGLWWLFAWFAGRRPPRVEANDARLRRPGGRKVGVRA